MSYLYTGGESVKVTDVVPDGDDLKIKMTNRDGWGYITLTLTPPDVARIIAAAIPEDPEAPFYPSADEAAFAASIML